ncbi:MAG: DUF1830 domain-containing protein [Cyanobacteria bacterium P01_A01_bin.15]
MSYTLNPKSFKLIDSKENLQRYRYHNPTGQFQIIRASNTHAFCIERTVLPHQVVEFEAPPQIRLEVYDYQSVTTILSNVITTPQTADSQ